MTHGRYPERPPSASEKPTRRVATAPPRTIDSRELFQAAREVHIVHGGEVYRLQVTSRDRLILVK